ncbi:hypothetical protein A2U01_0093810, partial [Trifolium medium]|nr:hypothetical protein [Trifolium medium]
AIFETPWFGDLANFKVSGVIPKDYNYQQKKIYPHVAVEVFKPGEEDQCFKLNGQRLKIYKGGESVRHKVASLLEDPP